MINEHDDFTKEENHATEITFDTKYGENTNEAAQILSESSASVNNDNSILDTSHSISQSVSKSSHLRQSGSIPNSEHGSLRKERSQSLQQRGGEETEEETGITEHDIFKGFEFGDLKREYLKNKSDLSRKSVDPEESATDDLELNALTAEEVELILQKFRKFGVLSTFKGRHEMAEFKANHHAKNEIKKVREELNVKEAHLMQLEDLLVESRVYYLLKSSHLDEF